jgi:hypothetical protein
MKIFGRNRLFDAIVTRIRAPSTVLRALYTANTGTRTMAFNNGAGPGVCADAWPIAMDIRIGPAPPEPEASRR